MFFMSFLYFWASYSTIVLVRAPLTVTPPVTRGCAVLHMSSYGHWKKRKESTFTGLFHSVRPLSLLLLPYLHPSITIQERIVGILLMVYSCVFDGSFDSLY